LKNAVRFMDTMSRLKRRFSRLVLRGPLLDRWITRKVRRLEHSYTCELLRASAGRKSQARPPALGAGTSVRRLLFISDILWEDKEIVPELQKICPVETLNLRPILRAAADGRPPREVVVAALRDWIAGHAAYEPDVILFYARGSLLSEEAFDLLRQRWKCPLLGMNLDEKTEFLPYRIFSHGNDGYREWARKFDLNLSNVRAVIDWYTDHGLPVYYMAEGYHPKFAEAPPAATPSYQYEMSFVGSKRPERETLMRRLESLGLPIQPLGYGWPDSSGAAQPEKIYRASMMNLGIGFASPSLTLTTVKTRDFECPGAGACYVTTWNWELALHYDIGREILCYRSDEELAEMFSFYRRRPEECARIAQAAWRRCLAEHTWEKRFRDLFHEVGLLK
jgi:hypothetical protein